MDLGLTTLASAAILITATAFILLAVVGGLVALLRPRARDGVTLIGAVADVTVAIPSSGVGAIVSRAAGSRAVRAARDIDGGSIGAGARVVVVEVIGGVAMVRTLPPDLLEVFR